VKNRSVIEAREKKIKKLEDDLKKRKTEKSIG
jgi:hypothetical protein